MKPEELSNWFLCPDVKEAEAVGSWVFPQVTFTGSVVLCGRFVVGGSLWEPLDVRCAQHLRIHLALAHVFQTLLDGSGQVHVGLVDAGSFDDSKARHHLNHLHTGLPVTKKKSGLFTWRLWWMFENKKKKKTWWGGERKNISSSYNVRSALPWASRTLATWRSGHSFFASSTHMFLLTPWARAS